jgi:peptidoglycan/LPS O-acetylase OafA/YrhL
LLFLWLRRGSLLRISIGLSASLVAPILLAHAGVPDIWKPVHHLADFLAGIAAAGIYNAIDQAGIKRKWLGFSIYLPAIAAGVAFIVHPQVLNGTLMNLNTVLRPLNVALLIGLACGEGYLARALSSKTADYLGQASYSMYILHIPLLWWFTRYTFYRFGAAPPAWTGFLFIAGVIAVSIAAFEFVETPANRWIRDWAAARTQTASPQIMRVAA